MSEETKELTSDKEIIDALALDLVQLAQQCTITMSKANYNIDNLHNAQLLHKMCSEILDTFIKKEGNNGDEIEIENNGSN